MGRFLDAFQDGALQAPREEGVGLGSRMPDPRGEYSLARVGIPEAEGSGVDGPDLVGPGPEGQEPSIGWPRDYYRTFILLIMSSQVSSLKPCP